MRLNPLAWPFRMQCLAGFIVCVGLLGYAYVVQFALGIEPCPLCIFQRLAFMAMALVFLAGAIHNPQAMGRRIYAVLLTLAAAVGIGFAAYHLWVQHRGPDPLAGCPAGFNWMVENYSLRYAWVKTFERAFTGHADCAEINWTFLGLSMPFWTLVSYALLAVGAVWAGMKPRR